jgi:glutaconate CoA-transferase subunit A
MYSMVQAGSMGVPFIGLRGLIGSDLLRHRPDILVIPSPFNPAEQVAVARPIRPDVAIFHALQADPWGNAITPGRREDLMLARASRRVIVTAEEIVPGPLSTQDASENTFLPAIDVDAVVYAPRGAHPCGCGELYGWDQGHLEEYLDAAKEDSRFQQYIDRYVRDLSSHQEYLRRLKIPS